MDVDEVRSWHVSKVRGWLTFFAVKRDLENEAYERSKRQAQAGR